MTHEQIEAIRERAENGKMGSWHAELMTAREDIPTLLVEVERLRNEITFIKNVDMTKNAYDIEHLAISVKCWAIRALEEVNGNET